MEEDELAYYADGAWYDAEYVHIGGDIPYYAAIAQKTSGAILELACGTGRLTLPMAQSGNPVTGVDIAEGMLARAEEKRARLPQKVQARLRFLPGDMRTLRLGERFEAVVLAFNTLMHLTTDEDLERGLLTAREHLAATGRFFVDLHTPLPDIANRRDPRGRFDPQQLIDPRTHERWVVSENNEYDPRTQINAMHFYYQRVDASGRLFGHEIQRTLRLRVIFPRELDRWLHLAGFQIVSDHDDLAQARPFSGTGGRRVLVLSKR